MPPISQNGRAMISRTFAQRLKQLEARYLRAVGESMVIEVRFVSPDKVVTGSLLVELAGLPYPQTLGRLCACERDRFHHS